LPLTQLFARNGWVDRWFFIRYSDPDKHIRLRFHLSDQRHLGAVIGMVYQALEQPLQQRLIWKLQTDTYEREVERYGVHVPWKYPSRFFIATACTPCCFCNNRAIFQEAARWYYGLLAADSLLNCFGMSLQAENRLCGQ
jgi:thiopeptide-type bacteriocin biosynthesis protein